MQTYFTSDTHFGHRRVIELCRRPFANVDEMNEAMIAAWNAVVSPDDTVWHLGDFAYKSALHPSAFFNRLNGRKHLVAGNHDPASTLDLGWASVSQIAEIQLDGSRIVMCHYPLLEWHQMWRRSLHLFGHVHGNRFGMPNSLDVGVDVWDFAPASLAQIRERLAELAAAEEATADETPSRGYGQ